MKEKRPNGERSVKGGHISVAFELNSNYGRILPKIERFLRSQTQLA